MDYQHILTKAWEITWHKKYLWVLGFCAGLTLGNINNGNLTNSILRGITWIIEFLGQPLSEESLIALSLLIISILFLIIGILARIGLVLEVTELSTKNGTPIPNIGKILRTSAPYILPILGMQLLIWIPVIILSKSQDLVFQSYITNMYSNIGEGTSTSSFGKMGLTWLLSFAITILTIAIGLIDAFAFRTLILNQIGIKKSILYSIHLLKEYAGQILLLTLICGVIGIIVGFIVTLIVSPFLFLIRVFTSHCLTTPVNMDMVMSLSSCMIGTTSPFLKLFSSIATAMLTAIWVTFQSTVFTIAYHKLSSEYQRIVSIQTI